MTGSLTVEKNQKQSKSLDLPGYLNIHTSTDTAKTEEISQDWTKKIRESFFQIKR